MSGILFLWGFLTVPWYVHLVMKTDDTNLRNLRSSLGASRGVRRSQNGAFSNSISMSTSGYVPTSFHREGDPHPPTSFLDDVPSAVASANQQTNSAHASRGATQRPHGSVISTQNSPGATSSLILTYCRSTANDMSFRGHHRRSRLWSLPHCRFFL